MTGCPVPHPIREKVLFLRVHSWPHLLADSPYEAGKLACERSMIKCGEPLLRIEQLLG